MAKKLPQNVDYFVNKTVCLKIKCFYSYFVVIKIQTFIHLFFLILAHFEPLLLYNNKKYILFFKVLYISCYRRNQQMDLIKLRNIKHYM